MNQFVMLVDYVDPSLHGFQSGVQEQELLSRKSSASSTASLDRHEIRWVKEYMAYSCLEGPAPPPHSTDTRSGGS